VDASRPELVSKQLVTFLNEGDLDGVLGLYEKNAVFADLEGTAKGLADIRAAHQRFLDSGLTLVLNDSVLSWKFIIDNSDGSALVGLF
jgi:hypothetical protein